MASKLIKAPIIRNAIQCRGYAQANLAPTPASAAITSTVLQNKIFVAAHDNGSPLSRVSISFRAGSRYEPKGEQGLSHVLRNAVGLTTKSVQRFILQRKLQQYGASVSASVDREVVTFTLEITRNHLEEAVQLLTSVVSENEYRPWELSEEEHRLKYEIAGLSPQVRAVDLLHKAAFREGLGNSLFVPPRRIGKVSSESLQHFVRDNFTTGRCAVTGIGISQDRLLAIAQNLCIVDGPGGSDKASVFKSAELRKETGGPLVHVALATSGAKANSKEALTLSVLSRALGKGPVVKWGNDNSPLGKAVADGGVSAAVSGFNVSYSDGGLFGILLTTATENADKAVKAAVGVLKGIRNLDKFAIERGRNQLLSDVLSMNSSELADQLGCQGIYTGQLRTPSQISDEVAKITDADISTVVNKIGGGGLAMAAVGNLRQTPYLDELETKK